MSSPTKPDLRDGSMSGINGPMPPAQAQTFAEAPADWTELPRVGVSEMILRALRDRGLVEVGWSSRTGGRVWRRTP